MIIESVRVRNFRCIEDETLNCEPLTVLVGANGCGKSSFLRALAFFYEVDSKFSEDDCYEREKPILITVTYKDLTAEERSLFESFVENGRLVVEKEVYCSAGQSSQKYFGFNLQNPEFTELRSKTVWTEWRAAYAALRQTADYRGLPATVRGRGQGDAILREWEESHPDRLVQLRKEEQFFGARHVGGGRLDNRTKFVLIPAVLDAADVGMEKDRNATISQLLDLVVRSELRTCEDVQRFEKQTQARYAEIMQDKTEVQLRDLEARLGQTLSTYAPGTDVEMKWETGEIRIPMPTAETRLCEDEHASTIERCGHGAQRALILTLLQHLAVSAARSATGTAPASAEVNSTPATTGAECNLILGIEEPELYQHPDRQRLIARVLLQLTEGGIGGVAESTQVIYTTHSPLFTGIDRADKIRVLRKAAPSGGGPKRTQVSQVDLKEVAREIGLARKLPPGSYSVEVLRGRLTAVMTPWVNEGFFAKVAVLVEGEGDRAAILGAAQANEYDFEGRGISVLPCGGKTSLDRPAAIFRALGIAVYVIWDGDKHHEKNKEKSKPEVNEALLRLMGVEPTAWPAGVWETHACFECEVERTLRKEIGEDLFDKLVTRWRDEFEYEDNERALKNPQVVRNVLEEAKSQGRPSPTLTAIVERIMALL